MARPGQYHPGVYSIELLGWIASGISALLAAVQSINARREATAAKRNADQARKDLEDSVSTLEEQTQPTSLDEELGEVSTALSMNVARLHDISEGAKAFEAEVGALVAKADVAKAAAALHEEDAKKIAILLSAESQTQLKHEIDRLSEAHAQQTEALKRSGGRTAWATFVGGAIVGFGVNILTTWIMS